MSRNPIQITLSAPKARQGVPSHLASRFLERAIKPKKGKGAYSRKGRA